jgi:hypothetical protein
MAIPESFDSATGALTGDNLDHTIATGGDAARLTPSLRGDPDAGGQFQSAVHRPTPSLRDDPDAGGQIQGQLVMLGSTSRLVQAMASFSAAGAADTSNMLPLGAETSQPPFLTTPQHP